MSKRAKKEENKVVEQQTEEKTKDPTLFLLLWLGLPAVLMFLYAIFGAQ